MKKKKLKKKIKKLEKKVEKYRSNLATLIAQVDISLTNKIRNLSDAYTNRFNKFNPDDIEDLKHKVDILAGIDTLRVKKDGTGDVYEIPCKKVSKGENNGN